MKNSIPKPSAIPAPAATVDRPAQAETEAQPNFRTESVSDLGMLSLIRNAWLEGDSRPEYWWRLFEVEEAGHIAQGLGRILLGDSRCSDSTESNSAVLYKRLCPEDVQCLLLAQQLALHEVAVQMELIRNFYTGDKP